MTFAGILRRVLQLLDGARADAARREVHHAQKAPSSSALAIRRR
jgi:hypothetical protein